MTGGCWETEDKTVWTRVDELLAMADFVSKWRFLVTRYVRQGDFRTICRRVSPLLPPQATKFQCEIVIARLQNTSARARRVALAYAAGGPSPLRLLYDQSPDRTGPRWTPEPARRAVLGS